MRRTQPCDRAQPQRDTRYRAHIGDDCLPAGSAGHIGTAGGFDCLDRSAAAGSFNEPQQGQAQLVSHALAHQVLVLDRGVGGTAANCEVIATDDNAAAIDHGAAENKIGRCQFFKIVVAVILRHAGNLAEFAEAAVIGEHRDAFANCQPAAIMLALDPLGTAEFLGKGFATFQFVQFRLPGHSCFPCLLRAALRLVQISSIRQEPWDMLFCFPATGAMQ